MNFLVLMVTALASAMIPRDWKLGERGEQGCEGASHPVLNPNPSLSSRSQTKCWALTEVSPVGWNGYNERIRACLFWCILVESMNFEPDKAWIKSKILCLFCHHGLESLGPQYHETSSKFCISRLGLFGGDFDRITNKLNFYQFFLCIVRGLVACGHCSHFGAHQNQPPSFWNPNKQPNI